jgi:hypothetical protein
VRVCPHQRHDPADQRPAQKGIQDEDRLEVALAAAGDGGQEVDVGGKDRQAGKKQYRENDGDKRAKDPFRRGRTESRDAEQLWHLVSLQRPVYSTGKRRAALSSPVARKRSSIQRRLSAPCAKATVLRNPEVSPATKLVALAAINLAGWHISSTNQAPPYRVRLQQLVSW